jgi:aryl-alcohol dehydrogenase-like predicted oxidoreductase
MLYQTLGQTGLRVSQLALGTFNFGTAWGHGANRAEARPLFNAFRLAGGYCIETADIYPSGESEKLIGEFIASARDEIVVATKCRYGARRPMGVAAVGKFHEGYTSASRSQLD